MNICDRIRIESREDLDNMRFVIKTTLEVSRIGDVRALKHRDPNEISRLCNDMTYQHAGEILHELYGDIEAALVKAYKYVRATATTPDAAQDIDDAFNAIHASIPKVEQ